MYIYSFILYCWKYKTPLVRTKTRQIECSIVQNYYGRGLLNQSWACRSAAMKAELQREHQSLECIIMGRMGGFTAIVTGFNPRLGAFTILIVMGVREKT